MARSTGTPARMRENRQFNSGTNGFFLSQELALIAAVVLAVIWGHESPWFWVILVLAPLWQLGLTVYWIWTWRARKRASLRTDESGA